MSNCSINGVSVAQICANAADGSVVNDPAPCCDGKYDIGGGSFPTCSQYFCTKNWLVNNGPGSYTNAPTSDQIKQIPIPCFSCSKSENYVQAPQAPWTRPGAYLNLNQTWGVQKSFQS